MQAWLQETSLFVSFAEVIRELGIFKTAVSYRSMGDKTSDIGIAGDMLIKAITKAERELKVYIAFLKELPSRRPASSEDVIAAFSLLSTAWDAIPEHARDAFTLRHSIGSFEISVKQLLSNPGALIKAQQEMQITVSQLLTEDFL